MSGLKINQVQKAMGPLRRQKILNVYKPKQADIIWAQWMARGLMGNFKSKQSLLKKVKNLMNSSITVKGKVIKRPKLMQVLHSLSKTGKWEGLPLAYKRNELTGQVSEVFLNKRQYQSEVIPLNVQDWVNEKVDEGVLDSGFLERLEKRNIKGRTRAKNLRIRLTKLTGIKFEDGHLIALANLGVDTPQSRVSELFTENRAHNRHEDQITPEDMQLLGLPHDNWSMITEQILEEGGLPANLGLPGDAYSQGQKARITRFKANPNQIIAERRQQVEEILLQRAVDQAEEAARAGNLDAWKFDILKQVKPDGTYINPTPGLDRNAPRKGSIVSIQPRTDTIEAQRAALGLDSNNRPILDKEQLKKERQRMRRLGKEWNPNTRQYQTIDRGNAGEGAKQILESVEQFGQGVIRDVAEQTPIGRGASIAQQVTSGNYVGAALSAAGTKIVTTERLPQHQRLLDMIGPDLH